MKNKISLITTIMFISFFSLAVKAGVNFIKVNDTLINCHNTLQLITNSFSDGVGMNYYDVKLIATADDGAESYRMSRYFHNKEQAVSLQNNIAETITKECGKSNKAIIYEVQR